MSKYWSNIVKKISPYVPGEQPKDKKYIKLNTNENPYPPSEKVLKAISAAVNESLRLYPDPACESLRNTLAKSELNHNLALLNDIKNCIENARMKELGLSDFGDAIPDIDEVRARLNIETVKAKIAEYKGKVNGDPIDYYADKGIISDKPKEGEKDPRDSISDFTKKADPRMKIR